MNSMVALRVWRTALPILVGVTAACGGRASNGSADTSQDGGVGLQDTGGEVSEGGSTSRVVADGQGNIGQLAAYGESIYWSTDNTVRRALKRSGTAETLLSTTSTTNELHFDAGFMYWIDGVPFRASIEGGVSTKLATAPSSTPHLAISNGTLYWATTWGDMFAMPETGGPTQTLVGSIAPPVGLAADNRSLFWIAIVAGADAGSRQRPALMQMSRDGSTAPALLTRVDADYFSLGRHPLLLDEAATYWLDYGSGSGGSDGGKTHIWRIPKTGGSFAIVASADKMGAFAIDDAYVYWTEPRAGVVRRAAKSGSAAETLFDGQLGASAIAVDDTSVYWSTLATDGRGGSVLAGSKTPR